MATRLSRFDRTTGMLGVRPADLGSAFFDTTSFSAFTETKRWSCEPLRVASDIADAFTPLHWFLLHSDRTALPFPADGLSREQAIQTLVNWKFLVLEASTPQAHDDPYIYSGSRSCSTMFVRALDTLLQALENYEVKRLWPQQPKRMTALLFDLVESFHNSMVRWVTLHDEEYSLFAEASLAATGSANVLLLNPIADPRTDLTLSDELNSWQASVTTRLGKQVYNDSILHPTTPLRDFLFAASSRSSSSGQAPLDFSTATHAGAPSPAPAPAGSALKPGPSRDSKPKGEPSAPPDFACDPKTASSCLLRWKDPSTAQKFGRLLGRIFAQHVKNPQVRVTLPNGTTSVKYLCFAFLTEPAGPVKGCDNTMWSKGGRGGSGKLQPCNRAHIDLDAPEWANCPKETFQEVWEFAQLAIVNEYLEATPAFAARMA